MNAIILPSGQADNLTPLTSSTPEFLLPVANKPIVEHLIDLLVRSNIKEIILILEHLPYETEQYFSEGERWGAQISYSLQGRYRGLANSLLRIAARLTEPFLCLPGNLVTNLSISDFFKAHEASRGDITLAKGGVSETALLPATPEDVRQIEALPVIITLKALTVAVTNALSSDFGEAIISLKDESIRTNIYQSSCTINRISSLESYLEVNKLILRGGIDTLILPGKAMGPGFWVGTHSKIHPQAVIKPPVLIGNYCNIHEETLLGPDAIIGNQVIMDKNASVQGSIVLDNTYIGSFTGIKDMVIKKNCMINVPRSITVVMGDDIILGDLDKKTIYSRVECLFNRVLALIILLLSSPIAFVLTLYHLIFPDKKYLYCEKSYSLGTRTELSGEMTPKIFCLYLFRSKRRLIHKLPGLINVIKGDLSLVGLSPITKEQLANLPEQWQSLRSQAPAGLFHPWEAEGRGERTLQEKLVMENYYAATRSLLGDLKILCGIAAQFTAKISKTA